MRFQVSKNPTATGSVIAASGNFLLPAWQKAQIDARDVFWRWLPHLGSLGLREADGSQERYIIVRRFTRKANPWDDSWQVMVECAKPRGWHFSLHIAPWLPFARLAADKGGVQSFKITSPMTGKVLKVLVTPDKPVEEGDTLMVIEAMKMENRIQAETKGVVKSVFVAPNDIVQVGADLLEIQRG